MDNLLRYLWGGGKSVKVTGQLLAILLSPFTMNYRDGLSVISSGLLLTTLKPKRIKDEPGVERFS